jgi:uncharacterized protein YndB with AHSA1/START domain
VQLPFNGIEIASVLKIENILPMKNSDYGIVHKRFAGSTLLFSRLLPKPAAHVWEAITNPELLHTWLAQAQLKLERGGSVELRYKNTGYLVKGKITRLETCALLAYTWNSGDSPESLVTWELKMAEENRCILSLTHTFQHECEVPNILAGWHHHLDMLRATLDGTSAEWSWPRWHELRETYARS